MNDADNERAKMTAGDPQASEVKATEDTAADMAEEPLLITDDLLHRTPSDNRIDFERGMARFPPLTVCLIALNTALFGWEIATGALVNAQALVAAGALDKPEVLRGEWWRLLSAMFLHADAQHLVGNCSALYILGIACEHALGSFRSLTIYLLAGAAGSLLSVYTEPGPMVGASGAIFGLMGCVATFLYVNRCRFYVRDARISLVLVLWAVYTLATGWTNPHIANMAHLGGFLAGSLLALVVNGKHNQYRASMPKLMP